MPSSQPTTLNTNTTTTTMTAPINHSLCVEITQKKPDSTYFRRKTCVCRYGHVVPDYSSPILQREREETEEE